jgi:hypothetical protein
MSSAKHSSLSMKLWKVDNRSKNAPASRVNITSHSLTHYMGNKIISCTQTGCKIIMK